MVPAAAVIPTFLFVFSNFRILKKVVERRGMLINVSCVV